MCDLWSAKVKFPDRVSDEQLLFLTELNQLLPHSESFINFNGYLRTKLDTYFNTHKDDFKFDNLH